MEQRIFEMGLSVPATSLYLLLVALSDGGTTLNRANALNFWNLAPKDLDLAFTELVLRRVVGADPDATWFIRPKAEWQ